MHPTIVSDTKRIEKRSQKSRQRCLAMIVAMHRKPPGREQLRCGDLAHGFAACHHDDKDKIRLMDSVHIGIVTAFNDILSADQPYEDYPRQIKEALRQVGNTAQVAGGVPAMCDGVTQGQPGMELSLFNRDAIAQVPPVIHVSQEAAMGGPLALAQDGDWLTVDAQSGQLALEVDTHELHQRCPARQTEEEIGTVGRLTFAGVRRGADTAETGGSFLFPATTHAAIEQEQAAIDG